jgi:tRNA G18 (ribose-2'-O)-methylase SpoU
MPESRKGMGRPRGYFGIGIYRGKTPANIGMLWRSAHNFGASFIFTIGQRYKLEPSDTTNASLHIPMQHFDGFEEFESVKPAGCQLVGIEQIPGQSKQLASFAHPDRAVYLLGAEDSGLPKSISDRCDHLVEINTPMCLNVAVAGSIVMYARSVWKKP